MAAASPAASASSSRLSFYTANDSDAHQSTTASSPAHAAPCPFREARPLPRELKAHCHIFLEEQLYTCAVNLLGSTLGAGVSRRPRPAGSAVAVAVAVAGAPPVPVPVPVPPPSHLALLGSLAVHPLHTTRADKADHLVVSSLALGYLRRLLAMVGPLNADFRTAFRFCPASDWRRRPRSAGRGGSDGDMSDADSDADHDRLRGTMANEASVWSRGQDLWSTVGWAFNTATLCPHRWRFWKAWLRFMLDLLEADWSERERLDLQAHEANGMAGKEPVASRTRSMILMYLHQQQSRQAGFKRIVKALLADGGSLSSSSFPEVFEKEARGPRTSPRKRKREQVVDLEKAKFGDYLDEEDSISSGISEPATPQKPRDTAKDVPFGSSNPGLAESVTLRLRLFSLLSAATFALRRRSELNQLYTEFAAALKVLPLQMFCHFASQKENPLLLETHITITKELFHLLLPAKYKDPRQVDPAGEASGSLTMPMLEHCYMPCPANTVGLEDNARLSLVVESAIQLLWICDMVKYTDAFAAAALRGIEARAAKAKKRRTDKVRAEAGDALAQEVLAGSAERIQVLLRALEASADAEDST